MNVTIWTIFISSIIILGCILASVIVMTPMDDGPRVKGIINFPKIQTAIDIRISRKCI